MFNLGISWVLTSYGLKSQFRSPSFLLTCKGKLLKFRQVFSSNTARLRTIACCWAVRSSFVSLKLKLTIFAFTNYYDPYLPEIIDTSGWKGGKRSNSNGYEKKKCINFLNSLLNWQCCRNILLKNNEARDTQR